MRATLSARHVYESKTMVHEAGGSVRMLCRSPGGERKGRGIYSGTIAIRSARFARRWEEYARAERRRGPPTDFSDGDRRVGRHP